MKKVIRKRVVRKRYSFRNASAEEIWAQMPFWCQKEDKLFSIWYNGDTLKPGFEVVVGDNGDLNFHQLQPAIDEATREVAKLERFATQMLG